MLAAIAIILAIVTIVIGARVRDHVAIKKHLDRRQREIEDARWMAERRR